MATVRYTLGGDFDQSSYVDIPPPPHLSNYQVEVGAKVNLPSGHFFDGLVDDSNYIYVYFPKDLSQISGRLAQIGPNNYLDAADAGFLMDLSGNLGTVFLIGEGYGDILIGGSGSDTINGGKGDDSLTGGDGADRFNFAGPGSGIDLIDDFLPGTDKIWLDPSYGLTAANISSHIGYEPVSGRSVIVLGNGDVIQLNATIVAATDLLFDNVAPSADIVPVSFSVLEQAPLSLKGSDLLVGDPDSGSETVAATLAVTYGILTVTAGTSGATVTGSGSSSVTIEGSVAEINDLLRTNTTSTVTYTADSNAPPASATLTLTVDDNGNTGFGGAKTASDTATINITAVSDRPQATSGTIVTNEDTPRVLTVADFGLSDPDGDALQAVLIDTLPASGTLELDGVALSGATSIDVADIVAGKLAYVPAADADGDAIASFTFRVQDDGGTANGGEDTSATATITLDVTPVNDPPIHADKSIVTREDTAYTFSLADFGYSDPDGGDASLVLGTLPTGGVLRYDGINITAVGMISPADIAAGRLTYVPAPDANGDGFGTFTFGAFDSTGFNGTYFTPNYTMRVDVTGVNDAPVAADNTIITTEDTPYVFSATDFGFSDRDGNALETVKIDTLPGSGTLELDGVALAGATSVDAADIAAGKLAYVPAANANGDDLASFTFRVQDDGGTANGGEDTSAARTITLDVTAVNDPPVAADRTVSTKEDKTYIFKTADFAFSDVDGDALGAVRIKSLPKGGTLELDGHAVARGALVDVAEIGAGKLAYVPKADVNGTRSFSFKVADDSGAANDMSSKHKLSIDIAAVNDAPTLKLKHAVDSIKETANTSDARKMADIVVRDVDGGANTLSLGGKDKELFVIDDGDLYLKAGAKLDFETNPVLNVTVRVDDASVGRTPDARVKLAIAVKDVVETIMGDRHDNRLTGDRTSDAIDGKDGDDTISGGGGDDTIVGGKGTDVLAGGSGHDTFIFKPGDLPPVGYFDRWLSPVNGEYDLITDFRPGEDVIDLSSLDADSGRGGNQAFAFAGDGKVADNPHAVVYRLYGSRPVAQHTIVLGDTDADGVYDFKIVLKGHHHLEASDFIL